MRHSLDAEDAPAFRVDLERHAAELHPQDRQIVRRFLERDLLSRCTGLALLRPWSLPPSEGLLPAAEAHPLLIGDVHREAQHRRVDPTLRDLDQAPYRALGGAQGICDKAQAPGVGQLREAVVFPGERHTPPRRLERHPLVTVQDDHGVERRVRTEADDHMTPLAIHDVERVMVHPRPGLLPLDVADPSVRRLHDVPHVPWCPPDDDEEHPFAARIRRDVLLRDPLIPLTCLAVDDGHILPLRPAANLAGEASGNPHQARVVQTVIRSFPPPPEGSEPSGCLSDLEVRSEHHPVHAVVAAIEKLLEQDAVVRRLRHGHRSQALRLTRHLPQCMRRLRRRRPDSRAKSRESRRSRAARPAG